MGLLSAVNVVPTRQSRILARPALTGRQFRLSRHLLVIRGNVIALPFIRRATPQDPSPSERSEDGRVTILTIKYRLVFVRSNGRNGALVILMTIRRLLTRERREL